jgi:hypothetical protein
VARRDKRERSIKPIVLPFGAVSAPGDDLIQFEPELATAWKSTAETGQSLA